MIKVLPGLRNGSGSCAQFFTTQLEAVGVIRSAATHPCTPLAAQMSFVTHWSTSKHVVALKVEHQVTSIDYEHLKRLHIRRENETDCPDRSISVVSPSQLVQKGQANTKCSQITRRPISGQQLSYITANCAHIQNEINLFGLHMGSPTKGAARLLFNSSEQMQAGFHSVASGISHRCTDGALQTSSKD